MGVEVVVVLIRINVPYRRARWRLAEAALLRASASPPNKTTASNRYGDRTPLFCSGRAGGYRPRICLHALGL